MDETYVKVRGVWKYLYRAVDNEGNTIDFMLFSELYNQVSGTEIEIIQCKYVNNIVEGDHFGNRTITGHKLVMNSNLGHLKITKIKSVENLITVFCLAA